MYKTSVHAEGAEPGYYSLQKHQHYTQQNLITVFGHKGSSIQIYHNESSSLTKFWLSLNVIKCTDRYSKLSHNRSGDLWSVLGSQEKKHTEN